MNETALSRETLNDIMRRVVAIAEAVVRWAGGRL